jgi:MOSC domain-containing protein YiiM
MSGGRVTSIYVASSSADPMRARRRVRALPRRGLEGDRYFDRTGNGSSPSRVGREPAEVTLIEAEVIDHLRRDLGIDVEAVDSRRNIVTRGVALNALVGSEFRIGEVRLLGTGLCEPCVSLVKARENKHLLRGLVHKGGLCARILSAGTIAVGDAVVEAAERSPHPHRLRTDLPASMGA